MFVGVAAHAAQYGTFVLDKEEVVAVEHVQGKAAGGIELLGKGAAEQDEATQLVNGYRRKLSMALN